MTLRPTTPGDYGRSGASPQLRDEMEAALAAIDASVTGARPAGIPAGVYWSTTTGNFYDEATNRGQGARFYLRWLDRCGEFPSKVTGPPGAGRLGRVLRETVEVLTDGI